MHTYASKLVDNITSVSLKNAKHLNMAHYDVKSNSN